MAGRRVTGSKHDGTIDWQCSGAFPPRADRTDPMAERRQNGFDCARRCGSFSKLQTFVGAQQSVPAGLLAGHNPLNRHGAKQKKTDSALVARAVLPGVQLPMAVCGTAVSAGISRSAARTLALAHVSGIERRESAVPGRGQRRLHLVRHRGWALVSPASAVEPGATFYFTLSS